MTIFWAVLVLVAVQRLGELVYARHNTRRLLAEGAREVGAGHYPFLVALHTLWLVSLAVFVPAQTPPIWSLLAVFLALQVARLWVLASLGRYWTTRIITLPSAPLVRKGPYRLLKHPNYWIVAGEILVLPLAFGAWEIALGFSLANALLLFHRVRLEIQSLGPRRAAS